MPVSLLLVFALAFSALPAEAQTGGESDQEASLTQELAERYAPVIKLKEQAEPCDSTGEQYAPASADIVLDNPQILLRQVGDGNPVVKVGPSAADLHDHGEGFYLDFPGDALSPGCIFERDFQRFNRDRPAVVYAHVVGQEDAPDQLALQYWFFYYYNKYNNLHEGDWEGIQLLFDVGTVAEALEVEPTSVGYSQHFGGEVADWNASKLERQDSHPVVYPAVGSHASYFTSTLYIGRSGSQGFGCDNTEGPSVELSPDVVVLPSEVDDANDPLAWVDFEGKWGERQSGPFDGPTGPATKDRWTAPIDWHRTLRSSSVAIPGGTDTDTPIVASFCSVVGFGSAQYIGLQQNPIRLILIAAAVGLVGLLAARQTRWSAVEALPVVRRRTLGEIIRSVGRLHRRRPRLVVTFGLIHLAITLVVALVVAVVQLVMVGDRSADADLGFIPLLGVLLAGAIGLLGQTGAVTLVLGAVAGHLRALDDGERPSPFSSYRNAFRRFRDLAEGYGRSIIIVIGLAITIIGIPWAVRQLVRYQFVAHSIMFEDVQPRAALDRSSALVHGRWFHTALAVVLLNLVVSAINFVVGFLLLISLAQLPLWVFSMLSVAMSSTIVPFWAFGSSLLYGDARAEREGVGRADPTDADRPEPLPV